MKKFIRISELKMQKAEMMTIVGGGDKNDSSKPALRYAILGVIQQ